jgi:hypothetical protein
MMPVKNMNGNLSKEKKVKKDMSRLPFYDSIQLTPEEEEEAILQGKIKKYFETKNAPYWAEKENESKLQQRPKTGPVSLRRSSDEA